MGLLYNNLPRLAPYYLDSYIGFSEPQRVLFDTRFDQQLSWHRTTQLPLYADWLRALSDDLQTGVSAADIDYHHGVLLAAWKTLLGQLLPSVVSILSTVTDQQVATLFKRLDQRTEDYHDEYVRLSELSLRRKMADEVEQHLQDWVGELSHAQRRMITVWSQTYQPIVNDSIAFRRHWQSALKRAFAQRHDAAKFTDQLARLVTYPEAMRPLAYQQKLDGNRELFKRLLVRINASLSPRQRGRLEQRLHALASDFESLSAQSTD